MSGHNHDRRQGHGRGNANRGNSTTLARAFDIAALIAALADGIDYGYNNKNRWANPQFKNVGINNEKEWLG